MKKSYVSSAGLCIGKYCFFSKEAKETFIPPELWRIPSFNDITKLETNKKLLLCRHIIVNALEYYDGHIITDNCPTTYIWCVEKDSSFCVTDTTIDIVKYAVISSSIQMILVKDIASYKTKSVINLLSKH